MGQIVFNNQKPVYCNLAAITNGSHKNDVPTVRQIWLVDSKNLSKPDGTGKYDKYIVGDAEHHTAKWLAENDLRDIDNISGEIPSEVYSKEEVNKLFAAIYPSESVTPTPSFNAESDTVWNKPQTLSAAQKAQARQNIEASDFSGNYNDLSNKPTIPSTVAELSEDSTHRTVTDTEKNRWDGKLDNVDIVSASGTTLDATCGKYYKFSLAVTELTVNLPIMSGSGVVQGFIISLQTGVLISGITFSGDDVQVLYFDGYKISDNTYYEFNCLYDGTKWVIANTSLTINV